MAAAIKALNARIRANPYLDYVCSTHFWGPVSNFGIPVAAVVDMRKDPELISGRMTGTLAVYSAIFARYSMAITPKNYLLFACHAVNFTSQSVQLYRFSDYWYWGGKDKAIAEKAKSALNDAKVSAEKVADSVKESVKSVVTK